MPLNLGRILVPGSALAMGVSFIFSVYMFGFCRDVCGFLGGPQAVGDLF